MVNLFLATYQGVLLKNRIVAVVFALSVVLGISACAGGSSEVGVQHSDAPPAPERNTDPRLGWVQVFNENDGSDVIFKRCDGATLVYRKITYNSGVSTIPNSPECTK